MRFQLFFRSFERHFVLLLKQSGSFSVHAMSEEAASSTNVEEQPPITQEEGVEGDDGGEGGVMGFFSTSRPRDATDGIGKGLGNVAKGVFGGLSLMVAAPIQGAIDGGKEGGGAWGAIKGGGVGLGKVVYWKI